MSSNHHQDREKMSPQKNSVRQLFAQKLEEHTQKQPLDKRLHLEGPGTTALSAWFLGPKGENESLLKEMLAEAVRIHCGDRRAYFPEDPIYITDERKQSREHKASVAALRKHFKKLLKALRGSTPFWSPRWQSHMNWDLTLPGIAGYVAAMLYNPNNVAAEASPVTTLLEMQVGDDLCKMLGYPIPSTDEGETGTIRPWGHITCDGSVANLEAMWASRNLKYYPISLSQALKNEPSLAAVRELTVPLLDGREARLIDLDPWTQLNLKGDDVLALTTRIRRAYSKIDSETLSNALDGYTLQSLGWKDFADQYLQAAPRAPRIMAPSTMHYSWPKNAAILGIGKKNVIPIHVDLDARMRMDLLREALQKCVDEKSPVIMTVCVIGSTEESAVDPVIDVLAIREEFRGKGLEFSIHCDAAWGGYFASLLRVDSQAPTVAGCESVDYTPSIAMSDYVNSQYKALPQSDSITVDPHKAGYTAYPSGALCYRNSATRNLVSFTAPYVYHGGVDPTVGVYGVEGSKPGAAAAGVFLSHRVVPTTQEGYGKVLGKSLFNSKRLYSAVVTMAEDNDPFVVVPFQRLPAERENGSPAEIKAQLEFIRKAIVFKSNKELLADRAAMELFKQLGSDQIIIAYAFNLRTKNGLNDDVNLANKLNDGIFERLSLSPDRDDVYETPMILASSAFSTASYGQDFVDAFARRLGVKVGPQDSISALLSTTMNPWMTDTAEGNFIPTLIKVLRATVLTVITELNRK
jgi:glutamate/tyrosine decarboxylase-like PLP-dependent enzyme